MSKAATFAHAGSSDARPALAASFLAANGSVPQRLAGALARAVCAALLAFGLLWGFAGLVGLDVQLVPLALLCAVGALVGASCALAERARYAPALAALIFLAAGALAGGGFLGEGLRALLTSFSMRLADTTALRLPELALEDPGGRVQSASLFILFVAPLAGVLLAGLAGMQRRWWLVFLALPLLGVASVEELRFEPGAIACSALGAAGVFGLATPREAGAASQGASGFMRAVSAGTACLLAGAGLAGMALALSPDTWHQPDVLADARQSSARIVHDLRYGAHPNALPDGRLSGLSAWHAEDGEALVVQGRGVEPGYLRGFTGAVRSIDGWTGLSNSDYHAADPLFWWLHDSGFFAQSQLSSAWTAAMADSQAAGQAKTTGAESTDAAGEFSLENKAASSEYLYLPYGLSGPVEDVACKDNADETSMPRGLFGLRSYRYRLLPHVELAYPDIAALQYVARNETTSYWRDESNYNEFVYQKYARNSDADEALVTTVLGPAGITQQAHVGYVSAAGSVVSWLADNVAYDESVGAPQDGKDLLVDLMTGSKRGWSAHYATAAVAMLRHYGIPARYVEGYLVTPKDIQAAEGDAVSVPAANGHAWAEMYVDGTGWVPLETVPQVREKMPQPDWTRGIKADGSRHASIPPAPKNIEKPDESMDTGEAVLSVLFGIGIALLVLLIAFDVFAIVFFLVSLVRRLLARRRRRLAFGSSDDTSASRAMAAWVAALARYRFPQIPAGDARALKAAVAGAYGEQLAQEFDTVHAIGRKAAFSQHGASATERMEASGAAEHFAREVTKAQDVHARWIMKYIERLV